MLALSSQTFLGERFPRGEASHRLQPLRIESTIRVCKFRGRRSQTVRAMNKKTLPSLPSRRQNSWRLKVKSIRNVCQRTGKGWLVRARNFRRSDGRMVAEVGFWCIRWKRCFEAFPYTLSGGLILHHCALQTLKSSVNFSSVLLRGMVSRPWKKRGVPEFTCARNCASKSVNSSRNYVQNNKKKIISGFS